MEKKCFWNIYSLLLFIFLLSEEALHAQARMCFSASKTFDAKPCEGRSAAAADDGGKMSPPDLASGWFAYIPPPGWFPDFPSILEPSGEPERERKSLTSSAGLVEKASPPSREPAKGIVFPAGPPDDLDFDSFPAQISGKLPEGIVFAAGPPDDLDFDRLPAPVSAKLPKGMIFPAAPPDDLDFDRLPAPVSAKLPRGMIFPAAPPDDLDFDRLPAPVSAKLPKGMIFPAAPPDDLDFDRLPAPVSAKLPEGMVFPAAPPDDVD